MLFKAKALLR
jgi:histidine ammonia-lyase